MFSSSFLYSTAWWEKAAPIAGGVAFSTRAPDALSRGFFWLDSNAAAEDSQQPLTDYAWGLPLSDSGSSIAHGTAPLWMTPSGGTDLATREEGLRPSKIMRAGPAPNVAAAPTSAFETRVDPEPLVLGSVSESVNSNELDLSFDMAPGFHSFDVPDSLLATDLSAPEDLLAPDFIPEFLPFPDFVFTPGVSTFDALAAFMSPQLAAAAELAREVSVDDEPPVGTPERRHTEDAAVPSILPADERDRENVDAASPPSDSSAPIPDPESDVAQPAPRLLQWVLWNPGNQMGLEEDRRIGQTDFWCADAPAEHRHYRRSQPCDIPGCDVRFAPGSVGSSAFHDGRTQGHKRLRYRCPRPECDKTYGRADSIKVHLDVVVGVLQPIYGQEAVQGIDGPAARCRPPKIARVARVLYIAQIVVSQRLQRPKNALISRTVLTNGQSRSSSQNIFDTGS
ncbi:hypothetical protein FOMPIDRAFT_89029 [Fomitopsis schrenkii]|uniref:C2H2-type domain-containing protein n=1 Tax=Fomitopsis schrenkii TaxID=2126942 RepID=S8FYP6_FOMSC|nr:hypothetical protein FOMPIDRAFT_89029 [Fomitopsis schrenkii]